MALTPSYPVIGRVPETPPQGGPGISIACGLRISAGDLWIHGCLAIDRPRLQRRTAESWARALTAIAISEGDQNSYVATLLSDRLIVDDDVEFTGDRREPLESISFNFRLAGLLGLPSYPERYYIQASSRELRSNVLLVGGAP